MCSWWPVVRPWQGRRRGEDAYALDIAKRHLARGEISTAEFQQIRRHLEGTCLARNHL